MFPPFSTACLLEPRLGSEGGERRRRAEEGSPGTHPRGYSRSVPSPSPSLSFKISAVLCSPQKKNHNNQHLEKRVEEAKEEKEKQRKTQQHPWPEVSVRGTPGVGGRVR